MSSAPQAAIPEAQAAIPDAPPGEPKAPYIGLRPYEESEKDIFFGRAEEAAVLVNKIFNIPLVALFAPSGAGKSSILRTLIIPGLRELDAKVIYFDEWISDPIPALRQAVAEGLGQANAAGGEKSLLDMVQAANKESEQSVVVVLDQFEQFFLHFPNKVGDMGREIGALARSGADAHVVLALREEHLGSLELFHDSMLTVTQSRYRLGPLAEKGAREAIEEPLKQFGGSIEPGLVDTLIRDLPEQGEGGAGAAGAVSLPILQIVCKHLWEASLAREPKGQLTTALYQSLGGKEGVVDDYVRKVMQKLDRDEKRDMSRVLDLLAPKAGVKMPYPIDVLALRVHLEPARVEALVAHLETERIVRRRESGRVVELFHDAFIAVLREFIDEQKARSRRLKVILRAATVAGMIAAVVAGLVLWKISDENRRVKTLLAAAKSEECAKIEQGTRELRGMAGREASIWQRMAGWPEEKVLPALMDALEKNATNAAVCPAPRRPAGALGELAFGSAISIHYNDELKAEGQGARASIQVAVVRDLWKRLADRLWEEKQVRLPPTIDVVQDTKLPAGQFAIRVDDRIVVRAQIPPTSGQVAIFSQNPPIEMDGELKVLEERVKLNRKISRELEAKGTFMGFARSWSAPLWQSVQERMAQHVQSDEPPFSLEILPAAEAALAFEAFERVAGQPELYITERLVQAVLLEMNARLRTSCLIHAALARFDDIDECQASILGTVEDDERRARLDMICQEKALARMLPRVHLAALEAARNGRPSGVFSRILDRMADLSTTDPESDPVAIGKWVVNDNGQGMPPDPVSFLKAGRHGWACPVPTIPYLDAYFNVAYDLAQHEKFIRIRLGAPLVDRLAPGSVLRPELLEGIYAIRHDLHSAFGVLSPGVSFVGEAWPDNRYRIEAIGKKERAEGKAGGYQEILDKLRGTIKDSRVALVTVDTTVNPWMTDQKLMNWLQQRFSRNDVKMLLRGILASKKGEQGDPPRERSIHHLPWLLGSLPFWTQRCDSVDGNCLVQRLRDTQKARVEPPASSTDTPEAIRKGIDALERDAPEEAEKIFNDALSHDPTQVEKQFLAAYGAKANSLVRKRADDLCKPPDPGAGPWGFVYDGARDDIDDALELPDVSKDEALKARYTLCAIMYQLPTTDGAEDARRIRKLLDEHKNARAAWSAPEFYWIAYRLLYANAHQRAPDQASREEVKSLLLASFEQMKGSRELQAKIDPAFMKLLDVCKAAKSDRCMWDVAAISDRIDINFFSVANLGIELLYLDRTNGSGARLQQIRGLFERALGRLNDANQKERERLSLVVRLKAKNVELRLAQHRKSDAAQIFEAIEAIRLEIAKSTTLSPATRQSLDIEALELKKSALDELGRFKDAEGVVDELRLARAPEETVRYNKLFADLALGRVEDVAKQADTLLANSNWTDGHALFLSAFAHLLRDDADFSRSAERLLYWVDHQYRDYVRLMLWWRLKQRPDRAAEADQLLKFRLDEIPRDETQEQRLKEGELDPWREWLVEYFLNPSEENRRRIYDPIADEAAFASSPLSSGSQAFCGFRTEAYFYDALLQLVTGDKSSQPDRFKEKLNAVVAEKCFSTYEYHMARHLLLPEKSL